MSLPTYDQIIEPLLRYLVECSGPVPTREVYRDLGVRLALSEDDRQILLPSRQQPVYQNRIGWAQDRLKRAGLSMSPRRAMWQATDLGRAYVREHPHPLTTQEIVALARVERDSEASDPAAAYAEEAIGSVGHQSPDERIDGALAELREQTANELLEQISRQSPAFFEQLVLDLLHALGYGTSRGDGARVGRSGDGGIDGIISLDKLGLEKVYVQAKRWQSNVGRPDIQGFFGALAGRRATKGVFITTSSYTREAHEFAASVSDKIVLVDGEQLAKLMMDHGVGVQHRELRVPRVDSDYFEGE